MRLTAAALCALAALAAPTMVSAQATTGWDYAYNNGIAAATQADHNHTTISLSCAPPTGDIIIADYTFGRAARNVHTATVKIGTGIQVNIPATLEGRGRDQYVSVKLPQRPPILAGVQPHDQLTVTVNNVTHSYTGDSGEQLRNIAYACWGS
jgi:hypothetical protein